MPSIHCSPLKLPITVQAVRNFVQLCLEGYYDETVFHRLIKNYILQGGDSSGTGTGGESVYDKPFRDEFHSRLRFTHRYTMDVYGMDMSRRRDMMHTCTDVACIDQNL